MITTTPIAITISSVRPIESPRKWTVSVTLTSRLRISVPQMYWTKARMMNARPIEISSS
jgi:hypothetical protein